MAKPREYYIANCIERIYSAANILRRREAVMGIARIIDSSLAPDEAHRQLIDQCNYWESTKLLETRQDKPATAEG